MQWALKLRLVRCYELPAYGKSGDFSFECVLHDKEGDRIHASVKKPVLDRVKPILKEGHLDNKLSCTLWGDFVNDIMSHLEKSGNNPAIIILQMCRSKQFRGEIRVSNTFYVTKMIVKESFGEIMQFRERVAANCKTSNSLSNISAPTPHTIIEDISTAKDLFRTIEQISENNEVGSFWVYARIV
ncbi:hypothetical protein F511_23755 [Dorcoceras hygrometricum]|uniref:Replication protein A 70 kDa DNA-binding subunit B/D first OB fold domain-containing protein n=1 Tax=Dorcoceras hygrometricum TaxID=472368 RepID=A0A2Z7DH55_9LAMI|nr:hypothetical protein F511_23755 [Dorcoceras hygrometricum]